VCGTSTRRLLGGPEGASEVTARGSYHAARAREPHEALHNAARQHGLTEPALPIELAGERFFERAWTRSKEAGAVLGFALLLGTDAVHQELLALAATLGRTSG
jgi:hypothetical protein